MGSSTLRNSASISGRKWLSVDFSPPSSPLPRRRYSRLRSTICRSCRASAPLTSGSRNGASSRRSPIASQQREHVGDAMMHLPQQEGFGEGAFVWRAAAGEFHSTSLPRRHRSGQRRRKMRESNALARTRDRRIHRGHVCRTGGSDIVRMCDDWRKFPASSARGASMDRTFCSYRTVARRHFGRRSKQRENRPSIRRRRWT